MTDTAEFTVILIRVAVALAIGLFMGLERGWGARAEKEGTRVAGFRTFGLIALLGALIALVSDRLSPFYGVAVILVIGAVMTVAYWRRFQQRQDIGITTFVAELIALLLGILAGFGELLLSAVVAVMVTGILGVKQEMHRFLQYIERRELTATLRLLLISVVLLPILPDQGFGPWNALNPYQIWWMVVIIAAISYAGYFAMRLMGRRAGILVTGVFGGLASSTATTINLARLDHESSYRNLLVAGITASTAMMFPRMLVLVGIFAPVLVAPLALVFVPAALAAFAVAAVIVYRVKPPGVEAGESLTPRNPLELKVALQFGALLAVIMLLARGLREWIGDAGIYALAAASGLGDVDAVTLSFASMVDEGDLPIVVAVGAIILAALVNTAVKPALVAMIAGFQMARRLILALLFPFLAAGVSFALWQMEGVGALLGY